MMPRPYIIVVPPGKIRWKRGSMNTFKKIFKEKDSCHG